jgi:L-ribulokinase
MALTRESPRLCGTPTSNGVIDERCPGSNVKLEPDWALQDPNDYLEVLKQAVPAVLKQSGVNPADVIGLGIDFTACTMLPTTKPMARRSATCPSIGATPHAWVKLWKHHAAQPEANRINERLAPVGLAWLDRYGGKISSEWFFSKAMQIVNEAPEIYAAADRLIRSRRLGGLADDRRGDAQLLHRWLQGTLVSQRGLPA